MGGIFGGSKPRAPEPDPVREAQEQQVTAEEKKVQVEERQEAQKVVAKKKARTTAGRRQLMDVSTGGTANSTDASGVAGAPRSSGAKTLSYELMKKNDLFAGKRDTAPLKKRLGAGRNPRRIS